MLLEVNTSPQLMYAKKIGGEEWLETIQEMMASFVERIVVPHLQPAQAVMVEKGGGEGGSCGPGPGPGRATLARWVEC